MSPFQINFQNAFIQEWSADVQRQVGNTWLIDIGYVGTRGLHLVQETDPNQPLNMTDVSGASAAVQASHVWRRVKRAVASRPFPISPISPTRSRRGVPSTTPSRPRWSGDSPRGFPILAAYTYSKSIDTASGPFADSRNANFPQNSYDVAAEKAVSDFNFPQRLSLAYIWAMPFGSTTAQAPEPAPQLPDSGLGSGQRAHRRVGPAFYSGGERKRQRRG